MLALNLPVQHTGGFVGASFFSNSFGQPTTYLYGGQKYREPFAWDHTYWYWTAGLIYGYKAPFEHKVPMNLNGFSPGVVPAFGYQLSTRSAIEVNLLGFAGVMFSYVLAVP